MQRRIVTNRGSAYSFVHEQIREVLYQGLSTIRQRQLHQLTAEAIERQQEADGRVAARLAFHFTRGDDLQRALHFSIAAAEQATSIHAGSDAIRLYDNALDILACYR